jgi:hypothetical protein
VRPENAGLLPPRLGDSAIREDGVNGLHPPPFASPRLGDACSGRFAAEDGRIELCGYELVGCVLCARVLAFGGAYDLELLALGGAYDLELPLAA